MGDELPANFFEVLSMPKVELCPNCKSILAPGVCCMTYTMWRCWSCGAQIDSRVAMPETAIECRVEQPSPQQFVWDGPHSPMCECAGKGWRSLEEVLDG